MLIVRLLTFFGFAVLVRTVVWNKLFRQSQHHDNQHASTAYNQQTHAGQEQPIRPFFPSSEGTSQAEEREHRNAERRYWKWNIILTATSTAGALAVALFALGALNASRDAVKAGQAQVKAAQDQITATIEGQRAWLKFKDVSGASIRRPDGTEANVAWFTVTPIFTNIGQIPAQRVWLDIDIFVGSCRIPGC